RPRSPLFPYTTLFRSTDVRRGFVRGYSFEIVRSFPPVYAALWGMSTGRLPWGADHHRAYGELFDRTAGMVAITEDLPDPANSVRSEEHTSELQSLRHL